MHNMKPIIVLLILPISLVIITYLYLTREPGNIHKLEKISKEMQAEADFEEIRHWLQSKYSESFEHREIYRKDWPESISKLDPVYVSIYGDGYVKLIWGGGLGHWGLIVGDETLVLPLRERNEFRLEIKPGVYAWHEIQYVP